jgi:uncharacterized OB-fold protein
LTGKPLPQPIARSKPFWDALKAHRVDLQQCAACGHWIFYPRLHCTHCFSDRLRWQTISGRGELLTYTIARIPTLPVFADELPQMLAVVRLDEGPHLNTTLVGVKADDIRVGMRVEPFFDDISDGELTLLRFTPAKPTATAESRDISL